MSDKYGIVFHGPVSLPVKNELNQLWQSVHPDLQSFFSRRRMVLACAREGLDYDQNEAAIINCVLPGTRSTPQQAVFSHTQNGEKRAVGLVVEEISVTGKLSAPDLPAGYRLFCVMGHMIGSAFGSLDRQEGFIAAYQADVGAKQPHRDSLAMLWADTNYTRIDTPLVCRLPKAAAWVTANMPSADTGFFLPKAGINEYDLAGNTPLLNLTENLLYHTSLQGAEFAELLKAGADPFVVDSKNDTSVIDRIAAAQRTDLFDEIVGHIREERTHTASLMRNDLIEFLRANCSLGDQQAAIASLDARTPLKIRLPLPSFTYAANRLG